MDTTNDLTPSGKESRKKGKTAKAHWRPPEAGMLKINTDASFIENNMTGGTGLVVLFF